MIVIFFTNSLTNNFFWKFISLQMKKSGSNFDLKCWFELILKKAFGNFGNVVISNEFAWKQPRNPIILQKIDVNPNILFENGIQNFRLPINFWVVNRGKMCFYPESRD